MVSELLEGLSDEIIATVSPPPESRNDGQVEVTNLKTMGSYNWIDHEMPTIAIPGHPGRWKGARLPLRLTGESVRLPFNEENARKCGIPLGPNVRAIQVTQECLGVKDFDLSEERIDIVTNRGNLRKLLDFASSGDRSRKSSAFSHFKKFRIDAQLAPNGRTMVFTRYEPSVHNSQTKPRFLSFDELFERTTTEEHRPIDAIDADGNRVTLQRVGYHRIVRYDLLGMRFLVYSRVDTMVNSEAADADIENLASALRDTRLDTCSSSLAETNSSPLPIVQVDGSRVRYILFGDCVPQQDLMDIKVSSDGKVKWENTYPQFFLSQTPSLLVATRRRLPHSGTTITQTQTHKRETLQTQHDRQSGRIAQLVVLLGQMRSVMQESGRNSPLAFVWGQAGDMRVHRIERLGEYMSDEGLDQF